MGIFMYLLITLFCGYMAFELGRYVVATGDALPLIIVILLALLSIHCIRQIYKAIKNKDLDILDWTGVPRGTIGRKVSGFMLGCWGLLWVLREGTPPNKGKQGKSKGIKENQENPRDIKVNRGKTRWNKGSKNPKWNKGNKWDKDNLQTMVLSNTDRDLMGMEVCLCMGVCFFGWWRECRKPRETGGGDGVGSAPLVVRPCFPLALV